MYEDARVEVWKDIPGYAGRYQASTLGRIRSIIKLPTVLKEDVQPNGYRRVYLWENGRKKNRLVHRLVASAFIPNPHDLSDVNHLDEDKQNNRIENLEWCTHTHNMNYGHVKKRISAAKKGRPASEASKKALSLVSRNRKWVNDGIRNKFVPDVKLNEYVISGWSLGRVAYWK